MYFTYYYWTGNDPVSPSSHAPEQPIAVAPGATTVWYGYFFIDAPPLYGSYSASLTFDDACVVSGSVHRDPPTVTVTRRCRHEYPYPDSRADEDDQHHPHADA